MLSAGSIVFLPIGADQNTVVYRVVADDATPYFVKLRRGVFDETSVTLPKFLSDQGISSDHCTFGNPQPDGCGPISTTTR